MRNLLRVIPAATLVMVVCYIPVVANRDRTDARTWRGVFP
jgi:hypothetical protein